MSQIDASNFNCRISVQSQSTSQDCFGQPISSWTETFRCWALIDIQASQLLYSTAEFISKVTHRITLRWSRSVVISANQRIVYTEPASGVVHTYEIEAVLNDKQTNEFVTILCYELDGQE